MPATAQTGDPVLAALQADFTSKSGRVSQIIGDPKAAGDQLAEAKGLTVELRELQAKIAVREAEVVDLAELKAGLDAANEWAAEPVRRLPFDGKGGREGEREGSRWQPPESKHFRIDHVASPEEKRMMTGGFKSLGHFAHSIYSVGRDGRGEPSAVKAMGEWDQMQRKMALEQKAPSGMFELSDPDGGLLVPPEFSNQIYRRMVAQNQILSRLSPIPIASNVLKLRALKEDSRVDGSRGGGILGYWENEADQYTKSKTQFRPVELNLRKLTVFTFVTEELMADSNIAVDAFISDLAAKEINFKINDAVINGTGAGQPMGILTSNSKITVAAVSGQGANTFIYQNVLAMYARVVAGQRGSLIWLYNQDSEPQLFQLYQPTGTAAGVLIFTPNQAADGFNLMGRPALVMEQCQSLGTAGDVIAFAPDGYVSATKGGVQSFMSMHLRFDYDEFAFKWRFRFDGRPWDDSALTPFKGSNTVSSIVVLNSTRT